MSKKRLPVRRIIVAAALLAVFAVLLTWQQKAVRLLVEDDGTRIWLLGDEIHRADGPAIIYPGVSAWWIQHNVIHRVDGPAVVFEDGAEVWCKNGLLHRDGGPAITTAQGKSGWWIEGRPYRQDAPVIAPEDKGKQWGCNGRPLPADTQQAVTAGDMTIIDLAALVDSAARD